LRGDIGLLGSGCIIATSQIAAGVTQWAIASRGPASTPRERPLQRACPFLGSLPRLIATTQRRCFTRFDLRPRWRHLSAASARSFVKPTLPHGKAFSKQ
jgi:hypothetical protein